MNDRVFAAAVLAELAAQGYEFDPASILALLQLLLPIIQNLPCFKKSLKAMQANIDNEYREYCRNPRNRCPPKARKAMKDELGITDRNEQNDAWGAVCKVSFANSAFVAKKLIAA